MCLTLLNKHLFQPLFCFPGILKYDIEATADRWWQEASETVKHDFGRDSFEPKFKHANHEEHTTPDLSSITHTISHALATRSPKPIYYTGFLARTLPYVYHFMPTVLADRAIGLIGDWFEYKPSALQRGYRNGAS